MIDNILKTHTKIKQNVVRDFVGKEFQIISINLLTKITIHGIIII